MPPVGALTARRRLPAFGKGRVTTGGKLVRISGFLDYGFSHRERSTCPCRQTHDVPVPARRGAPSAYGGRPQSGV